METSAPSLSRGNPIFQWVICVALCATAASFAQGREAKLLNVQPTSIEDGRIELYGVVREIPDNPFGDEMVLAIQVTAAESDSTTESRREAQGRPCLVCTTTHYFLIEEEHEKSPQVLYRTAPGPVTYIHIDQKEYMVGRVDLAWVEDTPQLEKVTLLQTGFVPPLFKRRIQLRFDEPIELNSRANGVADMALRDAFSHMRPTTLPKVFPPGFLEGNSLDSG